ncbi:MAG: hypothetical protein K6F53_11740 [Lachnospiraceae bacterium]|nr:hypothetical protein [Lachnospiraceae bacterium]
MLGMLVAVIVYFAMLAAMFVCIYKNAVLVVFPFIAFAWGWDLNPITKWAILDGVIFAAIALLLCYLMTTTTQLGIPLYFLCYTLILYLAVTLALHTLPKVIIGMIIVIGGGLWTMMDHSDSMEYYDGNLIVKIIFRLLGGIMWFFTVLYNQSYIMHAIKYESEGWRILLNDSDFPQAFRLGLPYVFITFVVTFLIVGAGIAIDVISPKFKEDIIEPSGPIDEQQ